MSETLFHCPRCRRDLPRAAFGHHARKPGSRNGYCRQCMVDRQREWRATPEGRAQAAAASRRYHARKRAAMGQPGATSPA